MPRSHEERHRPRQSLATKILFLVFVSTFVTALVVTVVSVHSTYAFLRGNLDRSFPAALDRSADRLMAWLEEGRERLEEFAQDEAVRAAVQQAHPAAPPGVDEAAAPASAAAPSLEERLREQLAYARVFSTLLVVDPEGEILASAGTDAAPAGGLPPQLVELDSASLHAVPWGAEVVPVASVPVLGSDGRKIGSLHGVFRRDGLAAQLRSEALGVAGNVFVVDARGRVIAAGRQATGNERVDSVPLDLLLRDGRPEVRTFQLADGTTAIGVAQPVDAFGWHVVIHEPFDQAFAPVYSVLLRMGLLDLLVVLAFSITAWKVTSTVVRPIQALYDGARRISQGDLGVVLPDVDSDDELALLTRTFNAMTERLRKDRNEIEAAYKQVQEQSEELQRANEVLEQLSITDGLTRLHNHRYFQEHLTREIKRVGRTGEPLAMLVIDIDDFKQLNDRLGHAAGDELLVRIARTLNESVRASDLLARYGGEEFVVLAPGTDLEGAAALAEKIRTAVAESSFILDDTMRLTRVTISIGVAQYAGSRREFFESADRALYRAKAAGKNCVMTADDEAAI